MNQSFDLKLTLYQSFKEIFKVTVETTKKTLNCQRVIIYSTSKLPKGLVIAESVDPKYPSLLGKTIQDPFLKGEYLEMYCYGMSVSIDDIYRSNQNQTDLKDLAQLNIKSLAIAPITVDQKLLAFLVVHQFFESSNNNLDVVNLLTEQANQAGLTLSKIIKASQIKNFYQIQQIIENQQKQLFLTMEQPEKNQQEEDWENLKSQSQMKIIQNKTKNLLAELKQRIDRGDTPEAIFQIVVAEINQLLKSDRVIIYSLEETNYGLVIAESVTNGWSKTLGTVIDVPALTTDYKEYREHRVLVWHDTAKQEIAPWYLEQLQKLEIKAGIVAPIINGNHIFGLLIVHQCSAPRHWQQKVVNWITKIAYYLGVMLEYTNADVENQQSPTNQEMIWTQYFAQVIQKIRQSLEPEAILQNSVREVHHILDCDRVLVYTLNQDSYGTIVAESVSANWTKAQGRVIKDPCFEARYLEQYRDGRVRAWSNIYETGMSSCYIEQLEKLEVKANLVVPIINESQLFGLLVAQQCSSTRQWQPAEVRWLTQVAAQVGFALDNAQLLAEAQKLRQAAEAERKWTEYFAEAVQQIRQSLRTDDILKASVREVRRIINCDRVVVYSLNQENYGVITAESVIHGWTKTEGRVIKDPCFEAKYLDQYRDGRVRAWDNIYEAGMSSCYVEQLEKLEIKANLVTPIINQGKLFGLLVAHQCSNFRQWQPVEIRWLTQIANQVGLALDNAQILEKLEQAALETQEILINAANSSTNIQNTVQQVALGFTNLGNSCQNVSQTIDMIKDVSKQLAQQSMNITRALHLNQGNNNSSNSVMDLSDTMFSLMQQLLEATTKVELLFSNIQTEITTKTNNLESETQQLINGIEQFQNAKQKLEQIMALNEQISNLMGHITNSLENQIENSTFTQNSVNQLVNITERIAQQSIAMSQSLSQLTD